MASKRGAWGIEIGQAALKAIRLEFNDNTEQVVATAFDYVPHPKILSQPDAIPEELIAQSIEKFLSRNNVQKDSVSISVPGQSALTRFVQLPPVDASKISDIVQFEARQQIPFDLEEVIWDYQTFGSADEETGYMLDAEVGIFAMKRDLIEQHYMPFTEAKVELDLIQTVPLALFNFLTFDQLGLRRDDQPDDSSDHVLLLDMGVDNTTLIVSNGHKIWTRNVPIGGNHFTRALTKDMKLTFAKAEHLKCNATRSPDPRAVFQALRPVFNNFVAEIQRSIGFFSSVNREAQISRIVGVGNGFRMAGLQKFLQQNLQYDVERLDTFNEIIGDNVIGEPLFTENILTFAVPYGMALQELGLSRIQTNLLPPEILTSRIIRQKKPWALVTAATLLAGVTISTAGFSMVQHSSRTAKFKPFIDASSSLESMVSSQKTKYTEQVTQNEVIGAKANSFTSFVENRELWLDLYKAIDECLPRDQADQIDQLELPERKQIRLTSITADKKAGADLTSWYNELKLNDEVARTLSDRDRDKNPVENGFLVTLQGISYHDDPTDRVSGQRDGYVKATLLKNLQKWNIPLPGGQFVPVGQQGIKFAALTAFNAVEKPYSPNENTFDAASILGTTELDLDKKKEEPKQANPNDEEEERGGRGRGRMRSLRSNRRRPTRPGQNPQNAPEEEKVPTIFETSFQIQFVWVPTPTNERVATADAEVVKEPKKAAKPAAPRRSSSGGRD